MKQIHSSVFTAMLLVCVFALIASAFGQTETGQVSGTIRDASGAVVSGAKVTVKSINTGLTRDTTTNSVGFYAVPSLRPDTYDVIIEASGFQRYTKRLEVLVGTSNDVSAQLSVGGNAITVEVVGSSEGVAVNTENSTLSQVVSSKQV